MAFALQKPSLARASIQGLQCNQADITFGCWGLVMTPYSDPHSFSEGTWTLKPKYIIGLEGMLIQKEYTSIYVACPFAILDTPCPPEVSPSAHGYIGV